MAKCIMIQGTGSDVGKSIVTAGLCRVFKEDGYSVAPFKSQNMSLNSFVTLEGHEIARAQALQAVAAGIEPHVHMNPVLLKPNTAVGSQVILQGKVYGNMSSKDYQWFKKKVRASILESYQALAEQYDMIVIEGAGSCAEINLREHDVANMGLAQMVDAPVLLVGDIDRGGVFASLVGSMELLSLQDRNRVQGFIINKFRGDLDILKPGLEFLEIRTERPVLGVLPYLKSLQLPQEDSLDFPAKICLGHHCKNGKSGPESKDIKIGVIYLPHLSNFTDFDPLIHEPGVSLTYLSPEDCLEGLDLLILPGTKNTIQDLEYLRSKGFEAELQSYLQQGGKLLGICGGFQMLGEKIIDPYALESKQKESKGFGLIRMRTILQQKKVTRQVQGHVGFLNGTPLWGYEIHMGQTFFEEEQRPFATMGDLCWDGHISSDGNIMGTYIHGLFDNDSFRQAFLSWLKEDRSYLHTSASYHDRIEKSFNQLSTAMRECLNLEKIYQIMGI